MNSDQLRLSVVIPVYNEAGSVIDLHREVVEVCEREGYWYEVIFVDDGSTDNTAGLIKKLKPVKLVRLRKNFGQTSAMDAGIKAARGDYVVTMDGDRQNDPADIPRLLKHLFENDLDVVSGWRVKRKDTLSKRIVSKGARFIRLLLIRDAIHDSGCSLKVYKHECFDNISLYGEMHRFIPEILKIKGFSTGELQVNHRPRLHDRTKYNWTRTVKGFLDVIAVWFWNKFAVRPLHLLGGAGLVLLFFGLVAGIMTVYEYIRGMSLSDTVLPILTAFFLICGFLLIVAGLLADMLSKIYYERTRDLSYSIKEIFENH